MAWFIPFLVALAVNAIAILLQAALSPLKVSEAAKDMENPTAEAGRPIPVVFGTLTVKGGNVLWFGDKKTTSYKVGGKK